MAATRAIDDIGVFLPPPARALLHSTAELLESRNVHVDELLARALALGEAMVERGLDAVIEAIEALLERVYKAGAMERIGDLNPFLRDGAEIGVQIALNTLKAMTAADVAKIAGLIVIAVTMPNLLVLNGPEFLSMITALGAKLWHLP